MQRVQHEHQTNELIWLAVSDGKVVQWLAAGRSRSSRSSPVHAPRAPLTAAAGSGFDVAASTIGIIVALAGLVPLLLFISWALTPA
jgi:hypothetical protein